MRQEQQNDARVPGTFENLRFPIHTACRLRWTTIFKERSYQIRLGQTSECCMGSCGKWMNVSQRHVDSLRKPTPV